MFAEALLPLALALIMGSLGLTLTPADFRRVLTAPRAIGIGLTNLLLISPLLAFGVGEVYGLTATLAVGVVLLGASPGGTTANMFTHLARGDVALSVSMTAVSSVASVLTVPLFLSLGADHFGADDVSDEISMPGIAARVFLITVVPLSIGMLIRARRTAWALANMDRARKVALTAFVLVVIGAVASEFEAISDAFADIALAVVTLNVLAMSVGYLVARVARLDGRQSTAIAMELGVHNTTVALAIGTSVDEELAAPAAVYGLLMYISAGLFARFMARRNAPPVPTGAVVVETEVTGSPEAVWDAVATQAGLSAWFAPTHFDGDALRFDFGELGAARATVLSRTAPRRFVFLDDGWRPGAPSLITEIEVEDVGHGACRVRVISSLAGPADPDALQAVAASWEEDMSTLRRHLDPSPAVA